MSTACLHLFERVQTTALQPFWPSSCKQSKLLLFDRAVNVSTFGSLFRLAFFDNFFSSPSQLPSRILREMQYRIP